MVFDLTVLGRPRRLSREEFETPLAAPDGEPSRRGRVGAFRDRSAKQIRPLPRCHLRRTRLLVGAPPRRACLRRLPLMGRIRKIAHHRSRAIIRRLYHRQGGVDPISWTLILRPTRADRQFGYNPEFSASPLAVPEAPAPLPAPPFSHSRDTRVSFLPLPIARRVRARRGAQPALAGQHVGMV